MNAFLDHVIASFVDLHTPYKYLIIVGYGYLVVDPFSRYGAAVGKALFLLG